MGRVEVANMLIQKGANIQSRDADGKNCLHWGTLKGHLPVVSLFIANEVLLHERTNEGKTALHLAT